MSVNKYLPHLLVLPEDDANRQMANGFFLDPFFATRGRTFQVLTEAGGWSHVRDRFLADHVRYMDQYPNRFMVLLIDFDDQPMRLNEMKEAIPAHLSDRVFVIGSLKTPEDLRSAGLGSLEAIGQSLARECREDNKTLWEHGLIRHNAGELARLRKLVRPILFD